MHIFVNHSPLGGKGIFASKEFESGEIIELCPVVVLSTIDLKKIHQTKLHDYYFLWGKDEKECAIALGYGSLYNHSYSANAEYEMDFEFETITIIAKERIATGVEITINYNGKTKEKVPLWFDVKTS